MTQIQSYTFDADMWWVINDTEPKYGILRSGCVLTSAATDVEWYSTAEAWEARLATLGITPE